MKKVVIMFSEKEKNVIKPLVSVILPVYNGATYLDESIKSILNQTFTDFELIIVNDGSKDNSLEILRGFQDSRIQIIDQKNMGLAATLNKSISLAKGKYIARQDQDDISFPQRLEKQVAFLEKNEMVGMIGCHADIIGLNGKKIGLHKHPSEDYQLKFFLLHNNPFVHSSVMFRKTVFDDVGLYTTDPQRQPPEDYELFSRIARVWKLANLPEVLHIYREVRESMSRDMANPFLPKVLKISAENIAIASGNTMDNPVVQSSAKLLNGVPEGLTFESINKVSALLKTIILRMELSGIQRWDLHYQVKILFLKAVVKKWLKKKPL